MTLKSPITKKIIFELDKTLKEYAQDNDLSYQATRRVASGRFTFIPTAAERKVIEQFKKDGLWKLLRDGNAGN